MGLDYRKASIAQLKNIANEDDEVGWAVRIAAQAELLRRKNPNRYIRKIISKGAFESDKSFERPNCAW